MRMANQEIFLTVLKINHLSKTRKNILITKYKSKKTQFISNQKKHNENYKILMKTLVIYPVKFLACALLLDKRTK